MCGHTVSAMSFLTVYFFSKSLIWDESFCRFGGGGGGLEEDFERNQMICKGNGWGGSIIANRVLRRDLKFHVNEKKMNKNE